MKIIKSKERYLTQIDWLKSYDSFSFGEHFHPENRGWGSLKVINEDFIAPGGYFDTHPHPRYGDNLVFSQRRASSQR
jgi:redox-sensitive bicupin YhaK (pirin superfamily)